MSAAQFIGRVGGIAAALGVGVAILSGPAVAGAETDGANSRVSASASRADTAAPSRSATRASVAARSQASAPTRGRPATRDLSESILDIEPVNAPVESLRSAAPAALATPAVAEVPAAAATTLTVPAPTATMPAPSAVLEQAAPEQAAPPYAEVPPVPAAEVVTQYGRIGQWMVNKDGQVADWIGQPYCGAGTTVASCKPDTPGAKTMQEPINTVFVVQASSLYLAELKLDFAMKVAGFGPSCCSSVGYSGYLRGDNYKQFPRGGPLGLGVLAPLPFGLFQEGLMGRVGLGPAYRDLPFLLANTHVRNFGGAPDGNGNYIFSASASTENLDTTGGGLLPTHGYESFNEAREKLLNGMLRASWITGATNQGMVALDNAINPADPKYTTGDHDGKAQVIALGSMFGMSPVRTWFNV